MKIYYSIFVLIITSTILSCNAQSKTSLLPKQFAIGIKNLDAVQVLDVRTSAEYESGHIKGALLADWNNEKEFKRRIAFIDKDKPVYVYCLAGGRSAAAANLLRESGYKNVLELKGGMNGWKAANMPIEGKNEEQQMSVEAFENVINNNKIVLVDFGAEWCPPCKKMEPVLKSLVYKTEGKFTLLKVDGGKDISVLNKYNVTSLPVFIIFKDGKMVWRKEGVATQSELEEQLQ